MALIKTEAIVLRCRNYREQSKLITFYSKSHGKMQGIAKGVRDVKSRWGGALQSMASLNLMFYYSENRTLHLISGAEYSVSYNSIYDDFEKMNFGYRIVELINKTTEDHHENPDLFNLLSESLETLNNATKNYVNVLFNFELGLAKILGFEINPETIESVTANAIENVIENQYYNREQNHFIGVKEGNGSYGSNALNSGDIKILCDMTGGNFNSIMQLNISKSSEAALDRFFDNYFKSHFDNLNFSNTRKVIRSNQF
jgi:DNA repair protein RecO (recombination protein O)